MHHPQLSTLDMNKQQMGGSSNDSFSEPDGAVMGSVTESPQAFVQHDPVAGGLRLVQTSNGNLAARPMFQGNPYDELAVSNALPGSSINVVTVATVCHHCYYY